MARDLSVTQQWPGCEVPFATKGRADALDLGHYQRPCWFSRPMQLLGAS